MRFFLRVEKGEGETVYMSINRKDEGNLDTRDNKQAYFKI